MILFNSSHKKQKYTNTKCVSTKNISVDWIGGQDMLHNQFSISVDYSSNPSHDLTQPSGVVLWDGGPLFSRSCCSRDWREEDSHVGPFMHSPSFTGLQRGSDQVSSLATPELRKETKHWYTCNCLCISFTEECQFNKGVIIWDRLHEGIMAIKSVFRAKTIHKNHPSMNKPRV